MDMLSQSVAVPARRWWALASVAAAPMVPQVLATIHTLFPDAARAREFAACTISAVMHRGSHGRVPAAYAAECCGSDGAARLKEARKQDSPQRRRDAEFSEFSAYLRLCGESAFYMRLGSHTAMAGNAMRIANRMISVMTNGITPANIVEKLAA